MIACPNAEQLQSMLDEQLSGSEAMAVQGHAEVCSACRQALAELTGISPLSGAGIAKPEPRLLGDATQDIEPDAVFLGQLENNPPPSELSAQLGLDDLPRTAEWSGKRVILSSGSELNTNLGWL
jgi:hypothetical protein